MQLKNCPKHTHHVFRGTSIKFQVAIYCARAHSGINVYVKSLSVSSCVSAHSFVVLQRNESMTHKKRHTFLPDNTPTAYPVA